jgi:hypothetical protein
LLELVPLLVEKSPTNIGSPEKPSLLVFFPSSLGSEEERAMMKTLRTSLSVFILISAMLAAGKVSWGQEISPLSVVSLSLKIFRNEAQIGTATGFVLKKNDKNYLVTNRHVVIACGQDVNPANIGGWICANKLAILHNRLGHLGMWLWVTEDLFDKDGKPRWLEHPTLKGAADLVALPLANTSNVQFYPLDIGLAKTDLVLSPGESLSIVGFPFGLAQEGGLPIWKTGTIASDLDINYGGKPVFLVDTTSRPGMSGSPVYAIRTGAISTKTALRVSSGLTVEFLGVYSEQIPAAELGGVWKAEVLMALHDSLP